MSCSGLEKIVEEIRSKFSIPSVSAAFYMDGQVFTKTLGCNNNTYFAVGSCTKSIVAGAVLALANENKLSLDAEVLKYLPGYSLSSENITVRNVLSHSSGLPGCDLTWYSRHNKVSEEDIKEILSEITPAAKPGEVFIYNNMVYSLLGPVIENCTGRGWRETVAEKIFEPIEMRQVAFDPDEALRHGDVAVPYLHTLGGNTQVPYASIGAVAPAGCLYMTGEELLKWNTLLLKKGKWKGRQVLPAKAVEEMTSPQISDEYDGRIPELTEVLRRRSYGFGIQCEEFHGEKLIFHGGAIDGFLAEQFILPSKNFAAVFLSDLGGTWAREAFRYAVSGYLLGDSTDWIDVYYKFQEIQMKESENAFNSIPETENKSLYGDYLNPLYGMLHISEVNGCLEACIGEISMDIRITDGGIALKHPDFGILKGEFIPEENAVLLDTGEGVKAGFVRSL